MIPLTNHDFQWGRSEVVIIYPDEYLTNLLYHIPIYTYLTIGTSWDSYPYTNIPGFGRSEVPRI